LKVSITYWFITLFVLLTSVGFSQQVFENDKERLAYANEQFDKGNYEEAKPHMSHFLGKDPKSAEFNLKFGVCLLFTDEDKAESVKYLRYSAKQGPKDSRAIFFLGKAYHLTYRFNEALIEYERFKQHGESDDKKDLQVDLHISMAKNGKKLLRNLTELVVDEKKVSSYSRFQYSYDLSQIGGKILVTDEFQSKLDKKKDYRSLVYFPAKNQNVIFYSSYGKDGENGLDLYKVRRLPNGEWANSQILPPHINTAYDDSYGFLHSDGVTFYFCSKGHSSMGGYDVFKSRYDMESNTFGPPINLDYKINTPDDDIMYVVDSLNDNAYFASARSAKGGYLDVYKVRVQTFPMLNVILAGEFIHQINAADNKASIKVENSATGLMEGEFFPNSEGKYVIVLRKSGKYKLIVETPESIKIHSGIVDIPAQKTLKPLKQEILLVTRNGSEQLVIRNLFDEEVEDAPGILAQVINGLADPDINSDEFPDSLFVNQNDVLNDVIDVHVTTDDLMDLISEMVEEDKKEITEIENKMNAAYTIAKKNNAAAKLSIEEAERLLGEGGSISDANEKEKLIKEIEHLLGLSKEQNQKAMETLKLANNLQVELDLLNKDLEEEAVIAMEIEAALNEESHEVAVEKLSKVQQHITDIVTRNHDEVHERNAYEHMLELARAKQAEADKKLNNARSYSEEADLIKNKIQNLNDQKSKTKKQKDKDAVQAQIEALDEELKMASQFSAEAFAENGEFQKEASALSYQAELMNSLSNDIADFELTFTEQERDEIQTFINSVGSDINNNENSFAHFSEPTGTSTEITDEEALIANEVVDKTADYQDYENEISDASEIDDVTEKAQKENEINQNWIAILDEDIQSAKSAVLAENDVEKKKKLEGTVAALLHLKDEKEYLIEQNNKIIDDVNLTENVLDDYSDYEEELSETNNLLDPVEKAQKENVINNEMIVSIDENIQDVKDQLVLEEDTDKRAQLEGDIEKLTDYRSQTVDKIADNELIIDEVAVVAETETTDVNPNQIKYDAYQDKMDESSSISDEVERAETENEINNLWLADLKADAQDIKDRMDSEEDPAKELELLMGMNNIFKEMSVVEADIKKNDEIMSNTDVLVSETNLENSDSYKTLVNELDNEVVDESDFEKSYSTEKIFNNSEAQEKANNVEEKVDEITIKEQEIASLENDLFDSLSDKKKSKIQSKIEEKKKEIYVLEEDVSLELAVANDIEKNDNNSKINELRSDAEVNKDSAEVDKKFVEATYFEEKANENFKKADELRILAENSSDPEEKSDLLKQVNSNELAGRHNQEKSITALEELTNEDYVADYIISNRTETTDIVEPETTGVVETETTDIVEPETTGVVETETTDIVEPETTDIVEPETTDVVETETTDVVETETTDVVETETTDVVETETTDIVEPETTDIVETETTDVIETETVDVVETETTDVIEAETTDVIETETIDVVETEKADVMEVMELPHEEVAGVAFNPNETDIETFEVSIVADEKGIEDLKYTNSASVEMIAKNQVDIDELVIIKKEIKSQEAALYGASGKETKKINQQIVKLKEEKEIKEMRLAEVVEVANKNEADLALSGLNESKSAAGNLTAETFSKRQGEEFENAGNKLLADAEVLRVQNLNEKDKSVIASNLNEAARKEATAINYYKKAKKLYAEAVVEFYIAEQEKITSVEEEEGNRLSTRLLSIADEADAKAIEYANKSSELREEALTLKKEEKIAAINEADKYANLSMVREEEANNLRSQGNKTKLHEDAIIEEEALLTNLNAEEVDPIRKSDAYIDFYAKQQNVVDLENELEQEKSNANSYGNLALQQENKANDFESKAKSTNDESEKAGYLAKADELRANASGNRQKKQAAEATVEDLYNSLTYAKEERNSTIANLDEATANDYKALALSNYDKDPITEIDVDDVMASTFVPPAELVDNIFAVNTDMTYSEENPIPVNPGNPDGLIYKVQVGAFRKPIPQDLFKGFAPISAETIRDGITRYRVGYFTAWEIANNAKNEIRSIGYSDAFVVAIYNGGYMSLSEARKLELEGVPVSTEFVQIENNASTTTATATESAESTASPDDITQYVNDLGNDAATVEAVEIIEGLFFTVQVGAFSKSIQADNVFNVSPLVIKNVNGLYKYSTGIFRSVPETVERKNEMIAKGLVGAFITAYYNGEKVSITRANQLIIEKGDGVFAISVNGDINKNGGSQTENVTDAIPSQNKKMITVIPTNIGTEYYIDLGTFEGAVPSEIDNVMILLSDYKVETITDGGVGQYIAGVFKTEEEAELAKGKYDLAGIENVKVLEYQDGKKVGGEELEVVPINLPPTPVEGLEYRVFLGSYTEGVPQARSMVFLELDYLGIESTPEGESVTYYCGNEGLCSGAEVILKKFTDQGVGLARIVSFQNGEKIDVNEARQLTHE
jgi:hypothetical protein